MKPKPYIPPAWQLPHLLATPIGGKVLIVERCEHQPPKDATDWGGNPYLNRWHWTGMAAIECGPDFAAPLGPVGTVLACKEAIYWNEEHANYYFAVDHQGLGNDRYRSLRKRLAEVAKVAKTVDAERLPIEMCRLFLRTTAVDLRRVDTINSKRHDEVLRAGYPFGYDAKTLHENPYNTFKRRWLADNPGAKWGDWAWFITEERIERC